MSEQPDTNTATKPEWAKTNSELRKERGEKPSKTKWIVLGLVLIAVVVAIAMKPKAEDTTFIDAAADMVEAETIVKKYLASQEVATITAQTLQQQIKVTGSIQPLNVAQLPALISAQVDQVFVRPGDAVKKGQLMVTMDTENLIIQKDQQLAAIRASEAQLNLAESQLKRTEEMTSQGIAPSSQLEQAQSTVQAQKANLQAQESQIKATDYQLRNAKIVAPFAGVVSQRQTEPGQFVGVGSPLLEVVDLSVMELLVNVSTADSANIVTDMNVELTVEGLSGKTFTGTVSRISPVATRGTRTIPIYISVTNSERNLRGGMFSIGFITLNEKPAALSVAESAIRFENEQPFVFKIENDVIVKQDIVLGEQWGETGVREISSGLNEGDTIVVLPLPGLQVGDAVELLED